MNKDGMITLGVSKAGNPIEIPVTGVRMAINGVSGSGKSSLLNTIICQLTQKLGSRDGRGSRVVFHVIDPKITSLRHLAPRLDVYETEPANFLSRMQDFETIMLQRYAAMRDMGVSSLGVDDLDNFPVHYLIIEEANSVYSEVSKDAARSIASLYSRLYTRIRAANMCAIMVGHQFSTEMLPSVARDQLAYPRILMQSSSSSTVAMLADPEEAPAHLIKNPGEFYFIAGAGATPIRAKTWYMSDDEAREIAESYASDKRENVGQWNVEKPF